MLLTLEKFKEHLRVFSLALKMNLNINIQTAVTGF